jgi:exonuclease SbcD
MEVDYRFLCLHQAVEGAQVGIQNYTFRYTPDVIKGSDLPPGFTAILTGHIHRAQVLTHDLKHKPLPCPVYYPGAIERTDFAEMNEQKGYFILELNPQDRTMSHQFNELPTRPMFRIEVPTDITNDIEMEVFLTDSVANLPADAIIKFRIPDGMDISHFSCLHAQNMREIFPATMNFEISARRQYA